MKALNKQDLDYFTRLYNTNFIIEFLQDQNIPPESKTRQKIRQIIKESKSTFPFNYLMKVRKLGLGQIKSSKTFQQILNFMTEEYSDIGWLFLFQIQLTEQFISNFDRIKWKWKCFSLLSCKIQQNMGLPLLLSKMDLKNLLRLSVGSCPIGNKGITSILKLDLSSLEFLLIVQTKMTQDIVKVLKKKIGLFNKLQLQNFQRFSLSPIEKQTPHLCPKINKKQIQITTLLYVPQYSKFNLQPDKLPVWKSVLCLFPFQENKQLIIQPSPNYRRQSFINYTVLETLHQMMTFIF